MPIRWPRNSGATVAVSSGLHRLRRKASSTRSTVESPLRATNLQTHARLPRPDGLQVGVSQRLVLVHLPRTLEKRHRVVVALLAVVRDTEHQLRAAGILELSFVD